TTSYGRVLFIKIELFLVMVAISAYHAFVLRPRLAYALGERAKLEERRTEMAGAEPRGGRGSYSAIPSGARAANRRANGGGAVPAAPEGEGGGGGRGGRGGGGWGSAGPRGGARPRRRWAGDAAGGLAAPRGTGGGGGARLRGAARRLCRLTLHATHRRGG